MAAAGSARIDADIAVLGAGAAGLYAALCCAADGARVTLISATSLAQTASYWAQGGLAAALAEDDTPQLHLQDTMRAGRGLVRESAARVLCDGASARVADLERLGVRFDADRRGRLALGLEGGHSRRRVVHAGGSATGRRVVRQLSALVAESAHIDVVENARGSGLLMSGERCVGVQFNGSSVVARAVIVSTGGAAALWSRTTNPPGSIGAGMLLAHAAGAALADLEFVQFHPTAVIGVPGREGFLVTEAVRGEGAVLLGAGGERFVDELAPRDEVSRAIYEELARSGASSVSLDMRAIDPALFPNVVGALAEAGLDATREPIPVAPAAHYMMSGVVVDLHARSAGVPGLYVVGESACTGLHGANRLASNSLSECFVFGARAAAAALEEPAVARDAALELRDPGSLDVSAATREALWRDAGLSRTPETLSRLLGDAHPLARLIAACALAREESRGAHVRADHPAPDPQLDGMHTIVDAGGAGTPRMEAWS
jgi:L-aspartate oxidase